MKTEELMIGDWVDIANKGKKHNYQQIKGINGELVNTSEFNDIHISQLRSIPITPEILKKNGFVYQEDLTIFQNYEESGAWAFLTEGITPIGIFLRSSLTTLCTHRMNFIATKAKFQVHELQNALRLCNIDKEIEL